MRLPKLLSIGLAALGGAALSAPAFAGPDRYDDEPMPHMDMDRDHRGSDDRGHDRRDGRGHRDPRHDGHGPDGPHHGAPWLHPGAPMPGPWMPPCPAHAGPAVAPGCMPAYPGYPAMTYAVPMMMVPVLRQKPCPEEIVEEWVEEPAPVRRRAIPRRIKEKRVPIVPDKRVKTKRVDY